MSKRSHNGRDTSSQPSASHRRTSVSPRESRSQPVNDSRRKAKQKGVDDNEKYLEELINKCVRYILFRAGTQSLIRKTDVQKDVLSKAGRVFNHVIEGATKILAEVYGYKVSLCESTTSNQFYVITNLLSYEDSNERILSKGSERIAQTLILSHILMSEDSCTDVSLYGFLKSLEIDIERKHPTFGNVTEDVINPMIKERLIDVEVIGDKNIFKWGVKADFAVSRMKILNFVAKMYNKPAKSWTKQYESACEQEKILNNETAEMSDDSTSD